MLSFFVIDLIFTLSFIEIWQKFDIIYAWKIYFHKILRNLHR